MFKLSHSAARTAFAALLVLLAAYLPAHSSGFRHPGIFNSEAELQVIRAKAGGTAPHAMKQGLDRLRSWYGANLNYANKPEATVQVVASATGTSEQNFRDAGHAAYAQALEWVATDDVRYREKALAIINGWAAGFKGMSHESNDQEDLEAAWALPTWAAAGEILRHHGTGPSAWAPAEIAKFEAMLNVLTGYATITIAPQKRTNNWGTSSALALMAVGVFEDDSAKFKLGMDFLNTLLPFTVEKTGLLMETCRDCNHAEYNLLGMMAAAEIAWKQGIDFYGKTLDGQTTPRLLMGMEFQASALLGKPLNVGQSCGAQSCGGEDKHANGWEMGYNHYHNRMQLGAPATLSFVTTQNRPDALSEDHFTGWTTLTHGDLGDVRDPIGIARPRPLASEPGERWEIFSMNGRRVGIRSVSRPDATTAEGLGFARAPYLLRATAMGGSGRMAPLPNPLSAR